MIIAGVRYENPPIPNKQFYFPKKIKFLGTVTNAHAPLYVCLVFPKSWLFTPDSAFHNPHTPVQTKSSTHTFFHTTFFFKVPFFGTSIWLLKIYTFLIHTLIDSQQSYLIIISSFNTTPPFSSNTAKSIISHPSQRQQLCNDIMEFQLAILVNSETASDLEEYILSINTITNT